MISLSYYDNYDKCMIQNKHIVEKVGPNHNGLRLEIINQNKIWTMLKDLVVVMRRPVCFHFAMCWTTEGQTDENYWAKDPSLCPRGPRGRGPRGLVECLVAHYPFSCIMTHFSVTMPRPFAQASTFLGDSNFPPSLMIAYCDLGGGWAHERRRDVNDLAYAWCLCVLSICAFMQWRKSIVKQGWVKNGEHKQCVRERRTHAEKLAFAHMYQYE